MCRMFTVIALIAIALMIACGGGGTPMTVQEYATACANVEVRLAGDESDDLPAAFNQLDDILAEMHGWNPPEELEVFHGAYIGTMETVTDALKEVGLIDLFEKIAAAEASGDEEQVAELSMEMFSVMMGLEAFDEQVSAENARLVEALNDLSPEVRQTLEETGCNPDFS